MIRIFPYKRIIKSYFVLKPSQSLSKSELQKSSKADNMELEKFSASQQ